MRQHKSAAAQNTFSILTVDDDPIMTSTVQAYFQRSGYRVDVENDPLLAIERVKNGHYDILLLDFLMTPICGDQVVEQIRQFNQDIFIILLTGHKSMAPPIRTIRDLDIQGYYEKSDRFDQLELLVESCTKSIRQMRTIKSYRDGLASIMDFLPDIYHLQSMEHIAGSILQSAGTLMGSANVLLILDSALYDVSGKVQDGQISYITRAMGDCILTDGSVNAAALITELKSNSPLVKEKRVFLPIVDEDQQPLGALGVGFASDPHEHQVQLLEVFTRQISSAIHNALLHALVNAKSNELAHAYSHLRDSYFEMISAMRLMVDAKDIYTRGHSDRVSSYALQIARLMGKDEEYCERLRVAGLFHDIGKLSIPDSILLKDSSLTDEEYATVKRHSEDGVRILSAITRFQEIAPIVRSHHERMDGKGYPDGLAGAEIPEESRIIAVADSFDAMTSDRQYRKTLGVDRALQELERV